MIQKTLMALAGLALCASLGAQAAVVSFQDGLPVSTSLANKQTLALGLFDPSLGTLTSASLAFTAIYKPILKFSNPTAGPLSYEDDLVYSLDYDASLDVLDTALASALSRFDTLPGGAGTLAAGESIDFTPVNATVVDSTVSLNAFLAALTGSGNFTITCEHEYSESTNSSDANIAVTAGLDAGCGATITYTYDTKTTGGTAPEPGALALAGLALAVAGAATRRLRG